MAISSEQSPSASAKAQATAYIANERFHKRFVLPAMADHPDLTFSYSDCGRDPATTDPASTTPTILFIPGLMASRYISIYPWHAIGEKLGVRIITVDRPGMGHSTDVPLSKRLSTWLELVPKLLDHLGIKHVALASHSAGTMYCLNTLYHLRHLLHPERPFVALFAPWVHPSHSHVSYMQAARCIPSPAFNAWHHIPRFFVTSVGPAVASSGSFFSALAPSSSSSPNAQERNRARLESAYGLLLPLQRELDRVLGGAIFKESAVGSNSEAMQCIRKGGANWGVCDDYGVFVGELAGLERERRGVGGGGGEGGKKKLKVCMFYGETDAMVGKRGQRYAERCWTGGGEGNGGVYGDVLEFRERTVEGEDHDSIIRCVEVLESVFVEAGGVPGENPAEEEEAPVPMPS